MKGFVKVTPESLIKLTDKCCVFMNSFDESKHITKVLEWRWSELKKVEVNCYENIPFWFNYKRDLLSFMHILHDMADTAKELGDEIWLSELSYCHLSKLSKGDSESNPIYIMNY